MKHPVTLCLVFAILFCSCEKGILNDQQDFFQKMKQDLKDSVSAKDFGVLDFERAILLKVDSVALYIVRIPLKGKSFEKDFVAISADKTGNIKQGKFIHLAGSVQLQANQRLTTMSFEGNISLTSLDRQKSFTSSITKGYIDKFRIRKNNQRNDLVQPEEVLPRWLFSLVTQEQEAVVLTQPG